MHKAQENLESQIKFLKHSILTESRAERTRLCRIHMHTSQDLTTGFDYVCKVCDIKCSLAIQRFV